MRCGVPSRKEPRLLLGEPALLTRCGESVARVEHQGLLVT